MSDLKNDFIAELRNMSVEKRKQFESYWSVERSHLIIHGSDEAKAIFYDFETKLRPFLPTGYRWKKGPNREMLVEKHSSSRDHSFELFLYGPNKKGQIDYNLVDDGKNLQSYAVTLKSTFSSARSYPMNQNKDYKVAGFAYASPSDFHCPGHCIDHADTIRFAAAQGQFLSTYHRLNYIPEPPKTYWGRYVRNPLVAAIRRKGGSYMQHVKYPELPKKTADGTSVPEGVYFFDINTDLSFQDVYHVNWQDEQDIFNNNAYATKGLKYLPLFETSPLFAPVVNTYASGGTIDNVSMALQDLSTRVSQLSMNGPLTRQRAALKSRDPNRDLLNVLQMGADMDFKGVRFETDYALQADSTARPKLRSRTIVRAIDHAEDLRSLDEYRYGDETDSDSESDALTIAASTTSTVSDIEWFTEEQKESLLSILERPTVRFTEVSATLDAESVKDRFVQIYHEQQSKCRPL